MRKVKATAIRLQANTGDPIPENCCRSIRTSAMWIHTALSANSTQTKSSSVISVAQPVPCGVQTFTLGSEDIGLYQMLCPEGEISL